MWVDPEEGTSWFNVSSCKEVRHSLSSDLGIDSEIDSGCSKEMAWGYSFPGFMIWGQLLW